MLAEQTLIPIQVNASSTINTRVFVSIPGFWGLFAAFPTATGSPKGLSHCPRRIRSFTLSLPCEFANSLIYAVSGARGMT
jgi:hypothetical protein